jgi:hypothetical protein
MKDGKFEVGDEVVCIAAGHWPLTKDKIYVILKPYYDRVEVCNDLGEITNYFSCRFKLETARAYIYKETPRYSGTATIPAVALFQPMYFSALNEKDAEKYIGRTMEFADRKEALKNVWERGIFTGRNSRVTDYSFGYGGYYWQFCRTCPETFQKKKVKKTVERWINIYPGGSEYSFTSESLANISAGPTRIVCVHLSKEYEVEE